MYLKHGFSKAALSDQLKLLKIFAPYIADGNVFNSTYTFLKKYDSMKNGMKKFFFCEKCLVELVCDPQTGNPVAQQACGHPFSKRRACYSLSIPLEPQIAYFIENHINDSSKPIPADEIGDVTSGEAYQWYKSQGLIDDHTLTLQWNIDAAQCFENSEFNFTPCMGIMNEAKYRVRRTNIILFLLYFGNKKPHTRNLLGPCIEMLNQLETRGVIVNGVKWTIRLLIITVDTIERCILRNTTQFNGKFGCDFCLIESIY